MVRHAITIAAALLVLATGCSTPEETPETVELREIPAPDLSGAEETVRQQIEEKQTELEGLSDDAERAEAYGDLGRLYLTYSFLDAAEACFANARVLSGEDFRWLYLLGYLFEIQGRLGEASDVLGRALELAPEDAPSLIRLGRVRIELGAGEEAQPLFERVLEQNPDSAAALDGLGKVAADRGDADQAALHFERALELQPRASSVHHALGLAYRKLGDLELAEHHLGRGGEAPVQFADPQLSSVASLGRTADIYLVRGAQAFSESRYQQAADFYRRALDIDPTIFDARKALGFSLEKMGDIDGAVEQLEQGLQQGTSGDPEQDVLERAELLRILGGLRVLQGREEEALATFQKSLDLDPERLDTRLKLANALARRGDFEQAIGHYDQILAADPDISRALVQRATARINLGQRQQAIADFERAVEAAPEDPEPRLRFAEALEHLGDGAAAAEQRAAALRLAADDPTQKARVLAGDAGKLARAGELTEALEKYSEAVAADPGNIDARYQKAALLAHFGRFDEALTDLTQVLDAAPHHGPARRAEATALLLQGRYSEARERLEGGLEAMPRNRELAHALARLLASAPMATVRNGEKALSIATRVHQETQGASSAETLAMAFAETGRFLEAQQLQRQLLAAAEGSGRSRMADHWRRQLQDYEQAQPWRARSPDEVIAVMSGG